MLRVLAIAVLFLYFWYFSSFPLKPVAKPTIPMHQMIHRNEFVYDDKNFSFNVDGQSLWRGSIPPGYTVHEGKFLLHDICHRQPDGTRLLATGEDLYHHLQRDELTPAVILGFESNAAHTMQQGHVFYFTCRDGVIHRLDMCQPGRTFQNGGCQAIDVCTGKQEGTLLPDNYDTRSYLRCQGVGQPARRLQCPDKHYFLHSACQPTRNLEHYCRFNTEPFLLDDSTIVRCRDKQPVFDKCPEGTQLFGSLRCQSTNCVNFEDGHKIPLPTKTNGPFRYSPGYEECRGERVVQRRYCSTVWDPHLSNGDNLTHLPLVFDNGQCSVPSFCSNVTSDDPDVMVPVYEFTKHVRNWKNSERLDKVTGYKCEGKTRKRTALPAGQRIGKKFKAEPACDGTHLKEFVSGNPNQYYDCISMKTETCPVNTFFDGVLCNDCIPDAHVYNGIDFFKFNGLSHDGWIENWGYHSVLPVTATCTAPESELITIHNVCSHPECAIYPFLAQVKFSIKLRDQNECIFKDNKIIKRKVDHRSKYWSQRPVSSDLIPVNDEICTPGARVQSGHFVMDSSVYATCDESQPFVFCPSAKTTGIEKVRGDRFACTLADPLVGYLPASVSKMFEIGEVKRIVPLPNTTPSVRLDNAPYTPVPVEGIVLPQNKRHQIEADAKVVLEYNFRVTYPPDIALILQGFNVPRKDSAFLSRNQKQTFKPVTLPNHHIQQSLVDFNVFG